MYLKWWLVFLFSSLIQILEAWWSAFLEAVELELDRRGTYLGCRPLRRLSELNHMSRRVNFLLSRFFLSSRTRKAGPADCIEK